jgi:hypothetical protein
VQTAQQSSGLGCGAPVKAADGTTTGASCWLVIIPRGTADTGEQHIVHSGLFWDSWKHRIAVRLGFKAIGNNCAIGAAERQISGSELIAGAVASWQPALCSSSSGSVYTLSTGNESDALAAASSATVPAALALTSRPLQRSDGSPDPNAYAPIALSGISLAFAIDRQPLASADTPASVNAQAHQAFTALNLTPRLIAKLLTNSYLDSLPGDKSDLGYLGPKSPGNNARNLTTDPDFLAVNDAEWKWEALVSPSIADLLAPQGRSDVAWQLWRYVLADKDAASFLSGKPDPWGMIVNPWNATDAAKNKSGTALALPRDNFPKSDPTELPKGTDGDAVNLVTWRPYTNDLDQGGYLTLRGDGQVLGPWDLTKKQYTKAVRSLSGFQTVLGLTSTASAAKYQVVSASLLNAAGKFVAPSSTSITAAAAAMTASSVQPQVYEYDPASAPAAAAPSAYPLAMPVYAATNPAQGDDATRRSYAAFISYAATTGQTPGTSVGELPDGYAPLPQGWVTQATNAAATIIAGPAPIAPDIPAAGGGSGSAVSSYQDTAPVSVVSSVNPSATGSSAPSLAGATTPSDGTGGPIASVVPMSLFSGLFSAAAVPLLSRIRRRR